jgi:guanylate kinase
MEEGIDKGEFVEYAKVHTNMYGTSFKSVEKVRAEGKACILDIDIQGVQNVKKSSLDCKYLFLAPPSMDELQKRLTGRGTETPDKIQVRLENAKGEMAYGTAENFDAVVINNDLNETFKTVVGILAGWFPELDLH